MRRPWGALLLGALLCAHGKRRRRARADRPPGKVCPRVQPLQNSDPGSGTAQAGPETPRPLSEQEPRDGVPGRGARALAAPKS